MKTITLHDLEAEYSGSPSAQLAMQMIDELRAGTLSPDEAKRQMELVKLLVALINSKRNMTAGASTDKGAENAIMKMLQEQA